MAKKMRKFAAALFLELLAGEMTTLFALPFYGAALTESEIYELWGKGNCDYFMVNEARIGEDLQ